MKLENKYFDNCVTYGNFDVRTISGRGKKMIGKMNKYCKTISIGVYSDQKNKWRNVLTKFNEVERLKVVKEYPNVDFVFYDYHWRDYVQWPRDFVDYKIDALFIDKRFEPTVKVLNDFVYIYYLK